MSVTKIDTGRMVFQDAANLFITPYDGDTIPSGDEQKTYDIRAIVADSMSIEQDDNETNTKDWEFGDSPLLENVTLGSFQFSATCVDFQDTIMEAIFGCHKSTDGTIMFPNQYEDMYAAIRIVFNDSNSKDVILPKVKMNSKAVISTLKTGSAEGTISGTAYAATVKPTTSASAADTIETPMFFAATTAAGATSAWAIDGINITY